MQADCLIALWWQLKKQAGCSACFVSEHQLVHWSAVAPQEQVLWQLWPPLAALQQFAKQQWLQQQAGQQHCLTWAVARGCLTAQPEQWQSPVRQWVGAAYGRPQLLAEEQRWRTGDRAQRQQL